MFNAQLASANLGVLGNDDMSANDLETLKIYYPSLAYVFDHIANLQEMIEEAEDAAAGELKETTDEAERKLGWIEEHANELKGFIDQTIEDIAAEPGTLAHAVQLDKMSELVNLVITETEEFKP
jgi:vacuolar-type H+-ATPase subunit H